MTDIQKTILQHAHGTAKIDPDQQRKFLETFQERVIATASVSQAQEKTFQANFKQAVLDFQEEYKPIFLKLSPSLSDTSQLFYLKMAQQVGINATIVSADCTHSPFGLLLHTDHAINREDTQFQSDLNESSATKKEGKTSFWKKLFG